MRRRSLWFLLALGILLGGVARIAFAAEDDVVVIDPKVHFCNSLEQYGWAWYFWGCNEL